VSGLDLVGTAGAPAVPTHDEITAEDAAAIAASRSQATWKAYSCDWADFMQWCERHGYPALPTTPTVIRAYLHALAEGGYVTRSGQRRQYKASTIQRRLATITQRHKTAGWPSPCEDPTVRAVWAGIRRQLGAQGRVAPRAAKPITLDMLRAMLAVLDDGRLVHVRDRVILLFGFAQGLRRSELVGLDAEDVEDTPDGLLVILKRSKTDQEARGRVIGFPFGTRRETCPVRAWQQWIQVSGITAGPLFRSIDRHGNIRTERLAAQAVERIVRRTAQVAGLDAERLSGHSLRAGHVTVARQGGAPIESIKAATGHTSDAMVGRYFRAADVWTNNSAHYLGL
jgi:integrase